MSTDFSGVPAGQVPDGHQELPAAVLWDMDGTLVDTEPLWIAGERTLSADHDAVWTDEDSLSLVGKDLRVAAGYIRTRIHDALSVEAIIQELGQRVRDGLRAHLSWQPGARELFDDLHARGVPQALVTMSYRSIAEPVIEALPFDAVVTGDAVTRGKPDPEPYLRAASLLGVEAGDCLAIEDSGTGTASANAAGCWVLAVPHAVTVEPAPRRTIRPTLAGLRTDDLAQFLVP